jgi:biotin transport system substrate-specific component
MELIKQNSQTRIFKNLALIFIGTIALTISAKIKIPFYPVPMTMQTFMVMFIGIVFGYKLRNWSCIFYRANNGLSNWIFNCMLFFFKNRFK